MGKFDFLERVCRLRPRRRVSEWAEAELSLPALLSVKYGRFSCDERPYMREILDCFGMPGLTDLTLSFGAQLSKSTIFYVGGLYRYVHDPAAQMHVLPNETLARHVSANKLRPLWEEQGFLRGDLPSSREDWSAASVKLRHGMVYFASAASPTQLSSNPIRDIFCDEAAKFPAPMKDEAHAIDLAHQRSKTFGGFALRAEASTPTVEDNRFWQRMLDGDLRKYHVPCPGCGGMFIFENREGLKWDEGAKRADGSWDMERVRVTAHYVCPHCGRAIWDADKVGMMQGGHWLASRAGVASHRSYQLSSFYSPDVSFGQMAVGLIRSLAVGGLRDYYNGWLGMPWVERALSVRDEAVWACVGDVVRGVCPFEEPAFVGLFADVHQGVQYWVIAAISGLGDVAVVDYGTCLALADLAAIAQGRTVEALDGGRLRCNCGLVDSGYDTKNVYSLCDATGGLLMPSKGEDVSGGQPFALGHAGMFERLKLFKYKDYYAKKELYDVRISKREGRAFLLPADVSGDFLAGLCGQELVRDRKSRVHGWVWKDVRGDHFGDCCKMAIVYSWFAGM